MMSNRVPLAPRWIRERKWRHSLSARYSLLTVGGQSVPNFDYAMAEGVAKSFRSNFLEKLTDAMDEQSGGMRNAEMVKAAFEEAERITGEQPRLSPSVSFDEQLAKKFPKDVIARVRRRAEETTERDTYQAMEGFVHNMNTLHSRAGAQVKGCLAWW